MSQINIESGSMYYSCDDLVTLEHVSKIAKAAELIGIPSNAIVQIRVTQSWDGGKHGSQIYLDWTLPKANQVES